MNDLFSKPDYSLYSNAMTFMRRPLVQNPVDAKADVVVLGAPLDIATSGRPGARLGPNAIRRASVNLSWESKKFPWRFNLFEHIDVIDAGDLVFNSGDAQDFTERLEAACDAILASGKSLLCLGGDHFVTLPLLRCHFKKHGEMALIHFDAHTDTYALGSRYDHGTMFYHAPREGLVDPNQSVQVGIRTEYTHDGHQYLVINAMQANEQSAQQLVEQIKQRVGDKPVYLTFDIDCLDPAFAPGTGTPVCGGIDSNKALQIIRGFVGLNVVGMDVVEVSPPFDQSELTALAGASLALEMLYMWTATHQNLDGV